MKRSKFGENQVLRILKEIENGRKVSEVCRAHTISEATCYNWKAKYGGMTASDIKRYVLNRLSRFTEPVQTYHRPTFNAGLVASK